MNFTISIDDDALQKSLEQGVLNIDPKKVAEMSEQIIWQYLQKPGVIENLLFEQDKFYGVKRDIPRDWFVKVIKECFSMNEVASFKEQLLTTLDSNGEKIIVSTMAQVFSKMLMTYDMQEKLSVAFARAIGGNT